MLAVAEAADFVETDHLSATESAVHDDARSTIRAVHSGDVSDPSADTNGSQNPVKHRVLKTACLYVSFAAMGLCTPLIGTTVVHMERLFDSDTATMSWTFTMSSVGYFVGAVACGFIFDHVNHELLLVVVNCIEAVTILVAPFFTMLPLFIAMLFIHSNSQGFILASGQSYCVGLWAGHRYKQPALQAAHASWSLGATVGPFIIGQFLVELPQTNAVRVDNRTLTPSVFETAEVTALVKNYSGYVGSANYSALNTTADVVSKSHIAVVRYAYVTIGSMVFVAGILYAAAFCQDQCANHTSSTRHQQIPMTPQATDNDNNTVVTDRKLAKRQFREKLMTFSFLVLLFMFYHIYAYIELTPIDYFSTFAIKFLQWPVKDVSLLMSLFYGTHCAGRFLGVPLSFVLRPRTVIIINLLVTTIAYIILLPIRSISELLWVSAALSGLGMATTYATAVLWAAESVAISGRVASIVVAGGSLGSVIQPQIIGRLFDVPAAGGPMSMVYVLVSAAILHIILFACMLLFVAHYLKDSRPTELPAQETLVLAPQHDIDQ